MDKDAFHQYLLTHKIVRNKPYSESTAKERVGCCGVIEKDFSINLDTVIDQNNRDGLMEKVKKLYKNRSNLNTYIYSLKAYFTFMDSPPNTNSCIYNLNRFIPISMHFYKLGNNILPDLYHKILPELENHYECIMGFGRNLLGLTDSTEKRIYRIPVILSPEKKKKTYTVDDIKLSEKIADYARKCCGKVSEQVILKIIQNKKFNTNVLGEFCCKDCEVGPYIILYYKMIDGKTVEEKIANFANVLAHEYMHYMEYVYCSAKCVRNYINEFLSESMADFFGVLYSIKYPNIESLSAAYVRYNSWRKNFYTCWPNAEALYFYSIGSIEMGYSNNYADYENHGSVEKLQKVFYLCCDAEEAYKTLRYK